MHHFFYFRYLNNYINIFISSNMPVHKHQQEITNRRIKRRITNRICARRQTPTNSANMFLTLATQLPLQITNTPFANQLFNGSNF